MPHRDVGFVGQLILWGAAWSGIGGAGEIDAALAESGTAPWDSDYEYLQTVELHLDGKKVRTPFYWALPAVPDLFIVDEKLADETFAKRV